jgi:hypothetical protein
MSDGTVGNPNWKNGQSGNPDGRPLGARNRHTKQVVQKLLGRQFGSGSGKSCKANVVVIPIATAQIALRGAFPLIERRAHDHIDGEAVGRVNAANGTGREPRQGRAAPNNLHTVAMGEDLLVAWYYNSDIA